MNSMLETAIVSLTMFFATIGPLDGAALFAALTTHVPAKARRSMAIRGVSVAGGILLLFALTGDTLLRHLGISLAALRTSGGILLLLIGIDLVFARHSGGISTTSEENLEAQTRTDIAIFPLATPLLAGPGAMGVTVLQMAGTNGDWRLQLVVLGSIAVILLLALVLLLLAGQIQKHLGITGMHVISRIFGILLCALAVQFVFDGIVQSELFMRLIEN